MNYSMIVGMALQIVLATALFYLCFYAEISLPIRQWLAVWARLESGWSWIPRLLLQVGTCPACSGWWFGLLVWPFNESWTLSDVQVIDAVGAGLWSVVGVPVLWWLMSSALTAQSKMMEDQEEDDGVFFECSNKHGWFDKNGATISRCALCDEIVSADGLVVQSLRGVCPQCGVLMDLIGRVLPPHVDADGALCGDGMAPKEFFGPKVLPSDLAVREISTDSLVAEVERRANQRFQDSFWIDNEGSRAANYFDCTNGHGWFDKPEAISSKCQICSRPGRLQTIGQRGDVEPQKVMTNACEAQHTWQSTEGDICPTCNTHAVARYDRSAR